MKNYQIFTLIGAGLGIAVSLFLVMIIWQPWNGIETLVSGLSAYFGNDIISKEDHMSFIMRLALPIPFYVASIVLVFRMKNTKILAVILFCIAGFTFYLTFFYGIFSFIGLLAAGISSMKSKVSTLVDKEKTS